MHLCKSRLSRSHATVSENSKTNKLLHFEFAPASTLVAVDGIEYKIIMVIFVELPVQPTYRNQAEKNTKAFSNGATIVRFDSLPL